MASPFVAMGLFPDQVTIAEDTHRFIAVAAGRRWGKTVVAIACALYAAAHGNRVLWLLPTMIPAGVETWRELVRLSRRLSGFRVSESTHTLHHPSSGGRLHLDSTENVDSLRGVGCDYAVLDEADYQAERVWTDVVRPMLAEKSGRAILMSTPREVNGWFHQLFELGRSGTNPEWASYHKAWWDRPGVPPEEIQSVRASTPEHVFLREYGAEFISSEGARLKREWLRIESPPEGLRLAAGVDLAVSDRNEADYTAFVVAGRAPDGTVWITAADRVRTQFQGVLEFIQSRAEQYKPAVIAVERIGYQAAVIQELHKQTKLNIVPMAPKGDKVSRFAAALEARIESGAVRFAPNLPTWFISELLAFPIGQHDDGVDAAVYAHNILPSAEPFYVDHIPSQRYGDVDLMGHRHSSSNRLSHAEAVEIAEKHGPMSVGVQAILRGKVYRRPGSGRGGRW